MDLTYNKRKTLIVKDEETEIGEYVAFKGDIFYYENKKFWLKGKGNISEPVYIVEFHNLDEVKFKVKKE